LPIHRPQGQATPGRRRLPEVTTGVPAVQGQRYPGCAELLEGRQEDEREGGGCAKVGIDFDTFQDVLDFGCGCGRTLAWFANRPPRLYGTDIDAEAISWCRTNLDFAEFGVNDAHPPLQYPSEAFDLVYAISIFTHLDEDFQFRWLDELRRVTRTRGIVLLTLHGPHVWRNLPQEDIDEIEIEGFKFLPSNSMKGIFPDW
jgi:SAM-dependent methyltransferase